MFGTTPASEETGRANVPPPPLLDDVRIRFADQLAEVRTLLKDDFALPENKMYDHDPWILRFLFNPRYTPEQCADRFRKMIQTRVDDGVNEILEEIQAGGGLEYDITKFPHFEVVNRAFPESLWHTTDLFGQPVALQLLGKAEPKLLVDSVNKDEFYTYTKYKAEYMRLVLDTLSESSGKLLQWVQVIDLTGLGFKHMNTTSMDIVKSASSRVDQMYKECLGKILIVQAPRLFHAIWAMMKLWVTERTAQKVTLLGSGYKDDLVEFIPKDRWPQFLGGAQVTGKVAFLSFNASGAP